MGIFVMPSTMLATLACMVLRGDSSLTILVALCIGCTAFYATPKISGRPAVAVLTGLFLSLVGTFGGGVARDLISKTTPKIFFDFALFLFAVECSLFSLVVPDAWRHLIDRFSRVLDLFSVLVFSAVGVHVASQRVHCPFTTAALGVVTAIGGGVLASTLYRRTPQVFLREGVPVWAAVGIGMSAQLVLERPWPDFRLVGFFAIVAVCLSVIAEASNRR